MELTKKTTILFPPDLHERLVALAKQEHVSVGDLVRTACREYYGLVSADDRLAAVEEIGRLGLPVADARAMKHESVPAPAEILP